MVSMKFTVKAKNENIIRIARRIGYRILDFNSQTNEYNLVSPVGGGCYPRFHIYLKKDEKTGDLYLNLHLDQKKPSYKGSPAHSGEYDGELVQEEVKRIEAFLSV